MNENPDDFKDDDEFCEDCYGMNFPEAAVWISFFVCATIVLVAWMKGA